MILRGEWEVLIALRREQAGVKGGRAHVLLRLGLTTALAVAIAVTFAAAGFSDIVDVNPNVSDNTDPNASSGGRVNSLASDPGNNQVFYAASEYGGLFKTINGGNLWFR